MNPSVHRLPPEVEQQLDAMWESERPDSTRRLDTASHQLVDGTALEMDRTRAAVRDALSSRGTLQARVQNALESERAVVGGLESWQNHTRQTLDALMQEQQLIMERAQQVAQDVKQRRLELMQVQRQRSDALAAEMTMLLTACRREVTDGVVVPGGR
jgi:chromosome segregation ATPase